MGLASPSFNIRHAGQPVQWPAYLVEFTMEAVLKQNRNEVPTGTVIKAPNLRQVVFSIKGTAPHELD